jgi:hypothetical protein
MAVEDDPKFKEWDDANQRYMRLAEYHNVLVTGGRASQEMLDAVAQERDQAYRALERIRSQL